MKPASKAVYLACVLMALGWRPAFADHLRQDLRQEIVVLKAEDGGSAKGAGYVRPDVKPTTAILTMHPEGDNTTDFRLKAFAKAGFVGFGIAGRYAGDDVHLIHEELMLDIAAGIRYVKEHYGVQRIVLLGHSGGGPLFGFYQHQAEKSPPNRFRSTPAGDPPDLNRYDLPKADGLILSAPHWGRGWAVLFKLDPSVVDDNDPVSLDPSLDLYNPANGFNFPPEPSRYSKEFLARYRAAQKVRMDRLVARARALVEEKKRNRRLMESPGFKSLPPYEQAQIQRRAVTEQYIIVYRRTARPHYVDLTVDASDRLVGGQGITDRPDLANYGKYWHPTAITAEAFLSSESTASHASLIDQVKEISVPTMVIIGTADQMVFLEETKAIFNNLSAADKKLVLIEGADHSYSPWGPKAGKGDQRQQMLDAVGGWVKARFP